MPAPQKRLAQENWQKDKLLKLLELLRQETDEQNPLSLQHPLSTIEIVPCDSSWTLILSKDKKVIDDYIEHYPKVQDLTLENQE